MCGVNLQALAYWTRLLFTILRQTVAFAMTMREHYHITCARLLNHALLLTPASQTLGWWDGQITTSTLISR